MLRWKGCPADESGNITVASVFMAVVIAFALAAVLDFGCAFAQHAKQEAALAVALDSTSTSATGLMVKNSDSPERDLAFQVVTALRRNGCGDAVTVYVKEATAKQVGDDSHRALAVYVEVSGTYHPMSAGKLIGDMEVASSDGCYLVPYSADAAWRPSPWPCKATSEATSDPSFIHCSCQSTASMPEQVDNLLSAAIEDIKGK